MLYSGKFSWVQSFAEIPQAPQKKFSWLLFLLDAPVYSSDHMHLHSLVLHATMVMVFTLMVSKNRRNLIHSILTSMHATIIVLHHWVQL